MSASRLAPALYRVEVLGVGISTVTIGMALETISRWIDRRERRYVCVTGVHGVMECQRDAHLRDIHNASGLTVPDGMPMVWACHHVGADWVTRVYGPDLMRAVCAAAPAAGWRMFLYGTTPDVVDRLVSVLERDNPGLRIVGRASPPFRPLSAAERDETVRRINAAEPDVVWVGLSTPKQERWMHEYRAQLTAPVLVGVGAAFDFVSGTKTDAPRWMQRSGLQWAFRLGTEPRRLWRRYLKNNPAFAVAIARRPPSLRRDVAGLGSSASPSALG